MDKEQAELVVNAEKKRLNAQNGWASAVSVFLVLGIIYCFKDLDQPAMFWRGPVYLLVTLVFAYYWYRERKRINGKIAFLNKRLLSSTVKNMMGKLDPRSLLIGRNFYLSPSSQESNENLYWRGRVSLPEDRKEISWNKEFSVKTFVDSENNIPLVVEIGEQLFLLRDVKGYDIDI